MIELICKDEVYKIVGAAMEVHRQLGCGFLEPVYQEALEIEFWEQEIPFRSQQELAVHYKNHTLSKTYIPDFVVFDLVIVEIKAIDSLSAKEEAQLLNYLKASGLEVGVLINFGAPKLQWERKVLSGASSKFAVLP